jgi:hypothetical protein
VHHCIAGVRLLALHLIKPHAPPRVEATVKQLKSRPCRSCSLDQKCQSCSGTCQTSAGIAEVEELRLHFAKSAAGPPAGCT